MDIYPTYVPEWNSFTVQGPCIPITEFDVCAVTSLSAFRLFFLKLESNVRNVNITCVRGLRSFWQNIPNNGFSF